MPLLSAYRLLQVQSPVSIVLRKYYTSTVPETDCQRPLCPLIQDYSHRSRKYPTHCRLSDDHSWDLEDSPPTARSISSSTSSVRTGEIGKQRCVATSQVEAFFWLETRESKFLHWDYTRIFENTNL